MRCKICGAKLNKEGDICKNCYQEILEEEKLEKDTNEKLKIIRKYIPKYEVYSSFDLLVILTIIILVFSATGKILYIIGSILFVILVLALYLLLKKRIAVGTKCVFYESKLKYNFDFLFIHKEKIIKYEDITDISYYQTRRQKKYDLVDLCVYVKVTGLLGGVNFKNMPNAAKNLEDIRNIVFKPKE